jgi:hypothetical protein
LIWPQYGFASIAYAATAVVRLSSPGLSAIPREARKHAPAEAGVYRRHPPLRFGPQTGAASIAAGL